MVSQRLHPAALLLPPCCQPLPSLATHCSPLPAQCWCWPLPPDTWSVIRLWSVCPPLSEQNEIRWAFFASIGQIQFSLRQSNNSQKRPMAMVTVMADRDGNCNGQWWQRWQWPMARATAMATAMAAGNATETAVAMVDGNCNGNGRRRRQWATATAMVTELAMMIEMATAITMATATARMMMTKAGLPLHVLAMCSAMAGATSCLHPHGHKGKCIHQCCIMGVTLLRLFPPFQGGGFLTAHHGLFFCLLFTTTVQFTEQPSVCPCIIQASGAQEPCQPIDALPPPLLQEPHQPIDNLPQLLLHILSR